MKIPFMAPPNTTMGFPGALDGKEPACKTET